MIEQTESPHDARPKRLRASLPTLVSGLASAATVAASLLVGKIENFREGFPDEIIYRRLVRNLIEGGFYGYQPGRLVAYRPPGYTFFNAGIRLLNDSQVAVRISQALLAGATVWLAAWIARRLFGDVAGAVTAILLLVGGTLIVYSSFELSETLATATLVAAVAASIAALDRRSLGVAAIAGILFALSALTRPQALLMIAPFAVWLALAAGPGPWKKRLMVGGGLLLAAILLIAPWTIRNAVRVHAFVPISTYGGEAFFLANNPKADGNFRRTNQVAPEEYARISALPQGEQEREWTKLALQFIRENPGTALRNWLRDGYFFVTKVDTLIGDNYRIRGRWRPPFLDDRLLWIAAIPGLVAAAVRPGRMRALIPGLLIGYFIAVFMIFLPLPRFRHGVVPFLAVYSGASVALLTSWIARGRSPAVDTEAPALSAAHPEPAS